VHCTVSYCDENCKDQEILIRSPKECLEEPDPKTKTERVDYLNVAQELQQLHLHHVNRNSVTPKYFVNLLGLLLPPRELIHRAVGAKG